MKYVSKFEQKIHAYTSANKYMKKGRASSVLWEIYIK